MNFMGEFTLKKIKTFLVNTVILVITSFLIRSLSITFEIFIAKKIGSEGIGLFNLIMSIYFLAITFANSGISLASTRIVAEEIALNRQSGAKIAMKKCINYSLIFGISSCALLIFLSPFICNNLLHNKIHEYVIYILAISLPFSSIASSINGYFIGVKRVFKNSIYEIINTLIKFITTFFMFNFFPPININYACLILIFANAFSEVFSFIFIYVFYRLDLMKISETRISTNGYLKRVLRISLPVAITSYIRSILSTVKQFLIPLRLEKHGMTSDEALSSYGIVNGMSMPLLLFPGLIINSVSSLLIPEFARYKAKNDYLKMCEVINVCFWLTIFFSFLVIVIYLAFHDRIANIAYGNVEVANYLLMLAPLMMLIYLDHITDAILKGIDAQVGVMVCNIVDLFMSIFLIYTLLPVYGINGYIFILYFSEIFNFSLSIYQLHKATGFKLSIQKSIFSFIKIVKPLHFKKKCRG